MALNLKRPEKRDVSSSTCNISSKVTFGDNIVLVDEDDETIRFRHDKNNRKINGVLDNELEYMVDAVNSEHFLHDGMSTEQNVSSSKCMYKPRTKIEFLECRKGKKVDNSFVPDAEEEITFINYLNNYLLQNLRLPGRGETVTGSIVQIIDDCIVVNIGCKKDGILPRGELLKEEADVFTSFTEGDRVLATVIKTDDGEGCILLSRKRLYSKTDDLKQDVLGGEKHDIICNTISRK